MTLEERRAAEAAEAARMRAAYARRRKPSDVPAKELRAAIAAAKRSGEAARSPRLKGPGHVDRVFLHANEYPDYWHRLFYKMLPCEIAPDGGPGKKRVYRTFFEAAAWRAVCRRCHIVEVFAKSGGWSYVLVDERGAT